MVVVQDDVVRPLGHIEEWVLVDTAANQQEVFIDVSGLSDIIIKVKNTHAANEMTIDIDFGMQRDESDVFESVISGTTIAFGVVDQWRFSDQFFDVLTDPGAITYTPVDPYYEGVLPCNYVKLSMFGTTLASKAKVWIQGIRKRR